ncbi:MAG: sigma-70 family RNA polymerase sigma factor, partial [bacterium]|nr:sigma-70 family RNA polymerase sigma factor [bacterium]MDW8164193.1 sigma-70 family RNA polymerase sigma factor [Candidatus Omnitrophota bacterium]
MDIKIENYFPLVKKILRKYENISETIGIEKEDLFQEGCFGLIIAKDKFKENLNSRFSTYATYWIEKFIIQAINR